MLGTALMLPMLRREATVRAARPARAGTDDWPAFRTLSAIIVLRSVAYVGLSTFLGCLRRSVFRTVPPSAGWRCSCSTPGARVGTVLGGRCAARWGRLRTLRVAYLASSVALAGVAFVPGPAVLVFVAAASLGLYVPFSLHITLGQDYLPTRMGTASGVTLRLAASVGGAFAPALGAIAQASSLRVTLSCLVVLPVLAALLGWRLREPSVPAARRRGRRASV